MNVVGQSGGLSTPEAGIIAVVLMLVFNYIVKPLIAFMIEKAKNGNGSGKGYDKTVKKGKTSQMELLKEMEKERRAEAKQEEIAKMLGEIHRWLDESRQDNRTVVIAVEKISVSMEIMAKSNASLVNVTRNQEKHSGKMALLLEQLLKDKD